VSPLYLGGGELNPHETKVIWLMEPDPTFTIIGLRQNESHVGIEIGPFHRTDPTTGTAN